jgi:hypothetical protein
MEIYQTQASVEQKRHSLRGLDRWMEVVLQAGILPAPLSAKYQSQSQRGFTSSRPTIRPLRH